MKQTLHFDLNNRLEPFTLILAHRNHKFYGNINTATDIVFHDNLQPNQELSFTVHRELHTDRGKVICNLWEEIKDFRYVYVPELKEFFNIRVETTDGEEVVKNITATHASVEELSNIRLYNIEINTENDIARDDYEEPTTFYNPTLPAASLLHRIFEKARHYTIKYVDTTLKDIQRTFAISNTSLYDFLTGTLAEEIGCLFVLDSVERGVYVYDLWNTCKECGYRGDFMESCPECGSLDLIRGYGEDTTIFVSTENLAESIVLDSDQGQMKNCFKVEGGDDLVTATVANCNPNGSNYIYRFSSEMEADMSPELVERLSAYNGQYDALLPEYTKVMASIYDAIDRELDLTSGMMPDASTHPDTTAREQLQLLTAANLSPVAVTDASRLSLATANSAVLGVAGILLNPAYRVEITSSTLASQIWRGRFQVTNYRNKEDVAASAADVVLTINDDYETYVRQRIEKMFHAEDAEGLADLLSIEDYSTFVAELKGYGLNRLISFEAAFRSCMDILVEQGCGDAKAYPDLYKNLYLPYYNKLSAIQAEMTVRSSQIDVVKQEYKALTAQKEAIQSQLNLETWLGEPLLSEFLAHRIEDVYHNENYISDGLSNAKLFETARELLAVAARELHRSSEKLYTISTSLSNLLSIREFRPLLKHFQCGNWLRIQAAEEIFKLRLLSYTISFDGTGLGTVLDVEFSDISRSKSMSADVNSILSKASSMAQSYSYISRQASKGGEAKTSLEEARHHGLKASNTAIVNADSQDIVFGENGILLRRWDDIMGEYSPEQAKFIHNSLNFTTDNWKTSISALGKLKIKDKTYWGLIAQYVNAGIVCGSKIIGGTISSDNYTSTTGSHINLTDGTFSLGGNSLVYDGKKLILSGSSSNITELTEHALKTTSVTATNLKVASANITGKLTASQINTTGLIAENISGTTLSGKTITGGTISGSVINGNTITGGTISGSVINGNTISGGTISGSVISNGNGTFHVDSAGRVTAHDIAITGGNIGGLRIYTNNYGSTYLETTPTPAHPLTTGMGNNMTWSFWAGYDYSSGDASFWVTQNGKIHVRNWIYGTDENCWAIWSRTNGAGRYGLHYIYGDWDVDASNVPFMNLRFVFYDHKTGLPGYSSLKLYDWNDGEPPTVTYP